MSSTYFVMASAGSKGLTASECVAIASALIALSALGVAVWQGYLTRKHNRLSARPLIVTHMENSTDGLFVRLINKGLGPAIFKGIEGQLNGKTFNLMSDAGMRGLLDELALGPAEFRYRHLTVDVPLAVGDSWTLFTCINHTPAIRLAYAKSAGALAVSYKYVSMYGEPPTIGRPRPHR